MPAEFPYVGTTYRLTEQFHFWTKHALINAILQPEEFVEIGEALAKEKGIEQAGWVRVSCKRGAMICKAYVTKRIKPMTVDGKPTHVIGVPLHWGFTGQARKGYGANTLTPSVGDANTQTPEFKAFLVNVEKVAAARGVKELNAMSDLQSQNFIRISATTITPPSVRRHEQEVAKLIDVTRCIGCKACQAACMEWNDLRGEVGYFEGTYDNPLDLDPNTWTLMRFTEWDNDQGNLEWLIRKDGCMHCEDPGCLKACPAPGAIVQYANGIVDFISENCIGCGYCIKGCPFNIPRVSKVDHKSYKCTLCSDRVTVGKEPACVKACPTGAIMFGSKADMTNWAGERVIDLKSRGFENAGLYDPPGVGGTHVMYVLHHADRPSLYAGLPDNPKISALVEVWKGVLKPLAVAGVALAAVAGFFHWITAGPNEVQPEDDIAAAKLIRERSGSAKDHGRRRMSYPPGNPHSQYDGGADQSLDHRRLLRAADAVGLIDVPPAPVLSLRPVRKRAMGAHDPSLDRLRAPRELRGPHRPVLARQFLEPGRHRLDGRDCARVAQ